MIVKFCDTHTSNTGKSCKTGLSPFVLYVFPFKRKWRKKRKKEEEIYIFISVARLGHEFKLLHGHLTFMELTMQYFLFFTTPFYWFKKGSYQFIVKVHVYAFSTGYLNHLGDITLLKNSVNRLTDWLDMTLLGWRGCKTILKSSTDSSVEPV